MQPTKQFIEKCAGVTGAIAVAVAGAGADAKAINMVKWHRRAFNRRAPTLTWLSASGTCGDFMVFL